MVTANGLYHSIIADPEKYPEKINATLERIQEVAQLVLDENAPNLEQILDRAGMPVGSPRESLNKEQAEVISRSLIDKMDPHQTRRMTQLLENAEISAAEAIELHEKFKIPVSHLEKDIIPVRGAGAWIWDIDGEKYLDMDSNYGATNLGMSNSQIARALFNQASQLISIKEDRVSIPRARFLKNFKGMLPAQLNQFYWQNSGGEAVDKSLKIAKAYTGQTGVVAFKGGFHGRTHGAIAVTYNLKYRTPFGLHKNNDVYFADFNNAETVESFLAWGKAKIVIMELIQGEEAGIRPAETEFAQRIRQLCDNYGAVMICDEVQTGFGRTAEAQNQWFACQYYNIVPDIMVVGKSFGGGYPVTAVVTTEKISKAMRPGYDGSTFGGNPMAMVAATIATAQMQNLDLTKNVVARSAQIKKGLNALKEKYPIIGAIRIRGLYVGFDLPSADYIEPFQKTMAQNGVKTSLATAATVRFLPPLIISERQIDFLLNALDKTLSTIPKLINNQSIIEMTNSDNTSRTQPHTGISSRAY